jgi:hypothetical protein
MRRYNSLVSACYEQLFWHCIFSCIRISFYFINLHVYLILSSIIPDMFIFLNKCLLAFLFTYYNLEQPCFFSVRKTVYMPTYDLSNSIGWVKYEYGDTKNVDDA